MRGLYDRLSIAPMILALSGLPGILEAQDSFGMTSDRIIPEEQSVGILNTQSAHEKTEGFQVPPSDEQREALIGIAAAIDSSSIADLDFALFDLECEISCTPLLDGHLFLHRAARDSTPEVLDALLAFGASIDHKSPPLGWTPLLIALHASRADNARALVASGADQSIAGFDGTTAPYMASLLGLGNIIPPPEIRLTKADANRTLLLAIEANNLAAVRFALQVGADANTVSSENGWSALMIASFNGSFEIVYELLVGGHVAESTRADVSYKERMSGMTAVHSVVLGFPQDMSSRIHRCTLSFLIMKGADVDAVTRDGLNIYEMWENFDTRLPEELQIFEESDFNDQCMANYIDNIDTSDDPDLKGVSVVDVISETDLNAELAVIAEAEREQRRDLAASIQRALGEHNCHPGPADGIYGQRSRRASIMFNLVADDCKSLDLLKDADDDGWQALAESNLLALEQCSMTPACGVPPQADFYREFTNGCWYRAINPLPDEYATWDQECDDDEYATGVGTLTYHYPTDAPDNYLKSVSGRFVRGIPVGKFTEVTVTGSIIAREN